MDALRLRRHRITPERGAVAAEFAILLPVLLLLLFGIIAVARAWNVHNIMDHAAREAARYGATSLPFDDGEIRTVALGSLASSNVGIPASAICIVGAEGGSGDGCPGVDSGALGTTDHVQVVITFQDYPLNFIFFELNPTIRASAFARYEGSFS